MARIKEVIQGAMEGYHIVNENRYGSSTHIPLIDPLNTPKQRNGLGR